MIFTSFEFVLFFTVAVLIRLLVRNAGPDKWILLIASLGFYASWNAPCLVFVLLTTFVDFSVARKLGQTTDPKLRRRLLLLSLVISLGLLGFFKYANFFLENVCGLMRLAGMNVGTMHLNLVQPPAISFYT